MLSSCISRCKIIRCCGENQIHSLYSNGLNLIDLLDFHPLSSHACDSSVIFLVPDFSHSQISGFVNAVYQAFAKGEDDRESEAGGLVVPTDIAAAFGLGIDLQFFFNIAVKKLILQHLATLSFSPHFPFRLGGHVKNEAIDLADEEANEAFSDAEYEDESWFQDDGVPCVKEEGEEDMEDEDPLVTLRSKRKPSLRSKKLIKPANRTDALSSLTEPRYDDLSVLFHTLQKLITLECSKLFCFLQARNDFKLCGSKGG